MAQLLERTYTFFKIKPLSVFFTFVLFFFYGPLILYPFLGLITTVAQSSDVQSFILSTPVLSSLQFSVVQATISTLLSGLIGVSFAFFILENGRETKSWFWRLGLLSFSMPSLVVVLSLLSFWGNEGVGISLFGWKGILLCHVMMNYPLFMKMTGEAWLAEGSEMEMSALSLGVSKTRVFLFVTLPKIRPAIYSAAMLCFMYCFCSFIPVAILGGDPRLSTFELNIYQALKFENDYVKAASLAVLQLVLLFPLYLIFKNVERKRTKASSSRRIKIYTLGRAAKLLSSLFFLFLLVLLSYGPLSLLLFHFFRDLPKVDISELFSAIINSLVVALSCLSLVLPVALSGAYIQRHHPKFSAFVSSLLLLPLFIPVMLLSASLTNSFSFMIDFFRQSYWAVAVIQAVVALPLLSRIFADGYQTISEELEMASLSLGASRVQSFLRLDLPLLKRFILFGSAIVICFSLGEVGTQLLFGSSQGPTLALLVFQKLGKYALGEAEVLGSVLMLLMLLVLWGTEKCKPC